MYKNVWNINSYLLTDKQKVWNDTEMGNIASSTNLLRYWNNEKKAAEAAKSFLS
jgi:dimeric dUTPase (all-alpha-NTP-PPase superfamily)